MTKAKGKLRAHTDSETLTWIEHRNFENAVFHYMSMLEKIKKGKHLSTSGELFSSSERQRLERLGVIKYRLFRNPTRSEYIVTPEALRVMASLTESMPTP